MSARTPGNPLWDKLRRHVNAPGSAESYRSRQTSGRSERFRDDYIEEEDYRRSASYARGRDDQRTYDRSYSSPRSRGRSPLHDDRDERRSGRRDEFDRRARSPLGERDERYERERWRGYDERDEDRTAMRATPERQRSFANRGEERPVLGGGATGSAAAREEPFDAAYYKTRIARLEEKLAKEHQKVKSTVKYYEDQFEVQAKKLSEKHEEEKKAAEEEATKLKSQVEWLKQAQESLKSERAAREDLEKELAALREEYAGKEKIATDVKTTDAKLKKEIKELKEAVEMAKREAAEAEERTKSAPPKQPEADPAEIAILQKQLDEEKAQRDTIEKKFAALKAESMDPSEVGLLQKKVYTAESELATVRGELDRAMEDKQEATVIKARLDVAEKLVYELKTKAQRVDELERFYADASKDKEHLRQAYDKIQEITDKLLAVTNEKEVLVRHSAQQAHVEAQLEQTRSELNRIKNEVHTAQVDKSNSEMNFKYVVDDISRTLREHAMTSMRWEARMASEISEASEEHAEIRRQTMNLVSTAESEAQRVMRDSITVVNDARRMLQDNHKKSEDIIEDVIRAERHRMSDETKTMKSQLVEAERRALQANAQIDDLSEQLRQMRIDLHLAKDAHAALTATRSEAPSIVDTARDFGSDGVASPSGEKVDSLRQKLRTAQFQLLALKARRKFEIDPDREELEEKLQFMREEREQLLANRPAAAFEETAEVLGLQDELQWCRSKIAKLEGDRREQSRGSSEREKSLEDQLERTRSELEEVEKTMRQLKKQQLDAFEDVAEDMESHLRIKLTEMREELMLANAQREKSRNEMNHAQDELIVLRSERDNAITSVKTMREELAELRQTISEMSASRAEIMTAGREEVRAREDELNAVRRELSNIRGQKESALLTMEELKSRLLDTEARLSEASEQRQQLELARNDETRSSSERNRLENKVLVLQTERDEMQTKLEQVIISREELEEELKVLLTKLNQSEEQTTATVAQSRSEVFMANQTISSLRAQLDEVESEFASASKSFERVRVDRDVATKALEEVREDLGQCEVELKLSQRETEIKERERQEAIAMMQRAQDALQETRQELEKTEAELVNLVEVVEQGEETLQRTKVQVTQKTHDLSTAEARLSDLIRQADAYEAERDVANELLSESRGKLSELQALSQIRENDLLNLRVQRDKLAEKYDETVNELKLTEAYLQKASVAVEKHRAERDGLSQALEAANDTLSATESQLQTVSAQLAELYEEVEEYRTQGGSEDEELIETQKALDAVIDKFKILRDAHEEALGNLEAEIAARQREQREHKQAIEAARVEYEEHVRILKRAVNANSDQGALASELFAILKDFQQARADAEVAGDESEKRTAAQYSRQMVTSPNEAAFESLMRIKTTLDDLKQRLQSAAVRSGDGADVETEALRTNLRLRVLVFETFIDLVSQRSRVGAYKGQVEVDARDRAAEEDVRYEGVPKPALVRKRSIAGFAPNINFGIKLFGNNDRD